MPHLSNCKVLSLWHCVIRVVSIDAALLEPPTYRAMWRKALHTCEHFTPVQPPLLLLSQASIHHITPLLFFPCSAALNLLKAPQTTYITKCKVSKCKVLICLKCLHYNPCEGLHCTLVSGWADPLIWHCLWKGFISKHLDSLNFGFVVWYVQHRCIKTLLISAIAKLKNIARKPWEGGRKTRR